MRHIFLLAHAVAVGAGAGLACKFEVALVAGVDTKQQVAGLHRIPEFSKQVDTGTSRFGGTGQARNAGNLQVVNACDHAGPVGRYVKTEGTQLRVVVVKVFTALRADEGVHLGQRAARVENVARNGKAVAAARLNISAWTSWSLTLVETPGLAGPLADCGAVGAGAGCAACTWGA